MLHWMLARVPGALHPIRRTGTAYAARFGAASTEVIVRAIIPYTTIKREQCELLIAFFDTFHGSTLCNGMLSVEVIDRRERIFQSIKALHGGKKN